jgi:hypothetical protein
VRRRSPPILTRFGDRFSLTCRPSEDQKLVACSKHDPRLPGRIAQETAAVRA